MKYFVYIWLLFLMLISTFVAADTPPTCGAASLYNLAQILGIEVELEDTDDALKEKNGNSRVVTNFVELIAGAKDIGIELQGVVLTYKHLQTFNTPIIAHLKTTFEDTEQVDSDIVCRTHLLSLNMPPKSGCASSTPQKILCIIQSMLFPEIDFLTFGLGAHLC